MQRQIPRIVKDLYINGKFTKAVKGQTFDVINPSDETTLATIQRGTQEDIDLAVKAAQSAFEDGPWKRMDPSDRTHLLIKLSNLIEKNADELALLESINNGKPASIAKAVDV